MPSTYDEIVFNELTDVKTGGVGGTAYFCSKRDVESCPKLPAEPSTDAEYTEIAEEFTMKPDCFFGSFPIVADSAKYRSELVGPKGTKLFKHMVTGRILGDGPAQRKMMRLAKNDDLIILIPTADCDGKYYILGNCCKSATFDVLTSDTGLTSEDEEAGNAFEISSYAYGTVPKPIFTGTVPLADEGEGEGEGEGE